ncbi:MAG: RodZ domain-containing protein [Halothiobacillaceae bacterium]
MKTDPTQEHGEEREEPRVDGAGRTLGRRLSDAADRQGLTAADLAAMLNLDLRTVQAIFDDRLQDTPGPMYIRAYIKSWAPALGLDADQVLDEYADVLGSHRPRETVRRETRPTLAVMEQERVRSRWFVWVFWLVVAMVVGLIGWQLLPSGLLGKMPDGESAILEPPSDRDLVTEESQRVVPMPPPTVAPEPVEPLLPAIDEPLSRPSRSETAQTSPEEDAAADAESGPETSGSAAAEESARDESGATTEPPAERTVRISTEGGESWVELSDSRGDRLMFGTLGRDESRSFEGRPPFELVLGNPAVVRVTYRGELLDLTPRDGRSTTRLTFGENP